MDPSQHLARLSALLAAERDEERARLDAARRRLSLAEREGRGLVLADVRAADEAALTRSTRGTCATPRPRAPGGAHGSAATGERARLSA